MIEVYSRCPDCGIDAIKVRQIRQYYPDVVVHKTGGLNNISKTKKHIQILEDEGVYTGHLLSIVVLNGNVQRLKDWN